MAYTEQTWVDGETPLDAEHMEHIESGIKSASEPAWTDITGKPTIPTMPTADTLSGATTIGKALIKAADEAAARTAIGAGTSSLALGTTASTAKAGNYTPPTATASTAGIVKQAAAQADSTATDIEGLVADFNSLLAKLKTAGIMA